MFKEEISSNLLFFHYLRGRGHICPGGENPLEQLGEWLSGNIIQCIIILSVFIQISPIKWNPITSLVEWLGRHLTEGIKNQIDTLQNTVKELRNDVDENEEDRIRWEVLDFANSCRNGRRHTKEEFTHIISLNDKYEELLHKAGKQNGYFTTEYKYILGLYEERQKKNDFLI